MLPLPDNRTCLASLSSRICPACGKGKMRWRTLCGGDYHRLPGPLKKALYSKIGRGYAEALLEAVNFLDVGRLYLPVPDAIARSAS